MAIRLVRPYAIPEGAKPVKGHVPKNEDGSVNKNLNRALVSGELVAVELEPEKPKAKPKK